MADEFNLVPTNNLEKHLDNILRTAQGGEPQYDLAPNWRTEQYLAAIASALASGGGGGDNSFVITFDSSTKIGDKKKSEVFEAVKSGKNLRAVLGDETYSVKSIQLQHMGTWSCYIYLIDSTTVGSDSITITNRSILSVYENSSDYVTLTVTKKKATGLTIENA